jgi:hypothetical protein
VRCLVSSVRFTPRVKRYSLCGCGQVSNGNSDRISDPGVRLGRDAADRGQKDIRESHLLFLLRLAGSEQDLVDVWDHARRGDRDI